MTIFTYLEFGTLALAGVLCALAAMEDPDRHLEIRPLPLPAERPAWSTNPRIEYRPRHDGWIAPLVKDDRYEATTRRINYRLPSRR